MSDPLLRMLGDVDLRILEAVLSIVQDEGEPFEHRLAGLSVLASYLMPMWQVTAPRGTAVTRPRLYRPGTSSSRDRAA